MSGVDTLAAAAGMLIPIKEALSLVVIEDLWMLGWVLLLTLLLKRWN